MTENGKSRVKLWARSNPTTYSGCRGFLSACTNSSLSISSYSPFARCSAFPSFHFRPRSPRILSIRLYTGYSYMAIFARIVRSSFRIEPTISPGKLQLRYLATGECIRRGGVGLIWTGDGKRDSPVQREVSTMFSSVSGVKWNSHKLWKIRDRPTAQSCTN